MRRFGLGLGIWVVVVLAGLSAGVAAEDPQAKADPAKELAAIQKDWSDAQQAFMKAYQAAKTNEERQQLLKEKRPKPADFTDRFLKLAEAHPESPQATQALAWVVSNGRGTPAAKKVMSKLKEKFTVTTDLDQIHKSLKGLPAFGLTELAPQVAEKVKKNLDHPQAAPLLVWVCSATAYGGTKESAKLYDDTVDVLMERFADRKELDPLTNWLPRDTNPAWAEKHLRTLVEKNSDDEVKAKARFGLASLLKNKDEASQPEAEKLLESFIEEFGKKPDRSDLVKQAKNELNDMKLRGIGKPAPDIAGNDLDDKPFKLSDYKGKVILLDFWAFW